MNQPSAINSQGDAPSIQISKSDLLAAWTILENLAVSFDQIGGFFGESMDGPFDEKRNLAFLEALKLYISSDLVERINKARGLLGHYVEDGESEAISEQINYWDYAASNR